MTISEELTLRSEIAALDTKIEELQIKRAQIIDQLDKEV
jgi:hypothetical protein